jgi:hypothetical protein
MIELDTPSAREEIVHRRPTISWITIAEPEEALDAQDCSFNFQMNRERLGISSDLSREMRSVHGLVVSCEEKISARSDPKLWI